MKLVMMKGYKSLWGSLLAKRWSLKLLLVSFVFLATSCTVDSSRSMKESTNSVDSGQSVVLSGGVENGATVDAQGDALTEEIIAMLEIRTFYFGFDTSSLTPESVKVLDVHAEAIKAAIEAGESFSIVLEGYTDERGSREYNLALGERRAESVSRYLRVNGVPASMVDTISYGEERPAVLGSNEEAWAKNRRVEIKY